MKSVVDAPIGQPSRHRLTMALPVTSRVPGWRLCPSRPPTATWLTCLRYPALSCFTPTLEQGGPALKILMDGT